MEIEGLTPKGTYKELKEIKKNLESRAQYCKDMNCDGEISYYLSEAAEKLEEAVTEAIVDELLHKDEKSFAKMVMDCDLCNYKNLEIILNDGKVIHELIDEAKKNGWDIEIYDYSGNDDYLIVDKFGSRSTTLSIFGLSKSCKEDWMNKFKLDKYEYEQYLD